MTRGRGGFSAASPPSDFGSRYREALATDTSSVLSVPPPIAAGSLPLAEIT